MTITSVKSNPKLWSKIVSQVKSGKKGGNSGQWSARKAQLAVKLYKSRGGKYSGRRSRKNSLHKWTVQKWRTKSGKPSSKTGERYLPEKAIKALSSSEYARTSAVKRKGTAAGKQFLKQPQSIANKVRKYRT